MNTISIFELRRVSAMRLAELADAGVIITVYNKPAFRIERINKASLDNSPVKVENGDGEEHYFSVKVNPETLEVKSGRRKDESGLDTPAIGEPGNGLEDEIL
jgi:hypothetical protein